MPKRGKANLFSAETEGRIRTNKLKLKRKRFRLNFRKNFLTGRANGTPHSEGF